MVLVPVAPPSLVDPPVVLRRHTLDDAEELCRVLVESRGPVGEWMPWARTDPVDVEWRRTWIRRVAESFDRGASWNYAICVDGEITGGCGIHPKDDRVATIGYWLHPGATGRGVATTAARLLTDAAHDALEYPTVVIRCDEGNVRSAAVARRLGYVHVAVESHAIDAPAQTGRTMVWQSPRSPA